jgi:hypothetical protein
MWYFNTPMLSISSMWLVLISGSKSINLKNLTEDKNSSTIAADAVELARKINMQLVSYVNKRKKNQLIYYVKLPICQC